MGKTCSECGLTKELIGYDRWQWRMGAAQRKCLACEGAFAPCPIHFFLLHNLLFKHLREAAGISVHASAEYIVFYQ